MTNRSVSSKYLLAGLTILFVLASCGESGAGGHIRSRLQLEATMTGTLFAT